MEIDPSVNQSMKGRCAIRGCSQLGLTRKEKKTTKKVCGLWSLPDAVAFNCLAQVSRLDLAALAIASKPHRSLVVSPELWDLRYRMGCLESYLYVCLHIFPEPTPRLFILHPVQRLMKSLYLAPPGSSFSFVMMNWGIWVIGGLIDGNPTSDVWILDCFEHRWYRRPPMKMARASASASLIDGKIYVFGGCGDDSDPSNWAEVYDTETMTWDFLSVSAPKFPLKIQQSVVIDNKEVYAVDEDGQTFSFSPTECIFVARGETDSKYRNDWCTVLFEEFSNYVSPLFCRGSGGRIMWCMPYELDWKEVKGLDELHDKYDIIKLCSNSDGMIVIFWNAQPEGPESLELCSAEIKLQPLKGLEGLEFWGNIKWSGAVFKLDPLSDPSSVKVLYADSAHV